MKTYALYIFKCSNACYMNAAIYFIYWQGGGGCFFLFPLVIINQELLVEHTTKLSFGCHSPMAYLYTILVGYKEEKKQGYNYNSISSSIQNSHRIPW